MIKMTEKFVAKNLSSHNNLRAFKQHGFVYKGTTGKQVYGYSIFSGKEDGMWINPETKMWDCKHTGKSGGYQSFLKSVHKLCVKNLKSDKLVWLKKNRGLSRTTLKFHEVGYNPHTDNFVIPVYDMKREKLWDLRIFNPKTKKILGTAGCTTALYGWEEIESHDTIWLCEGEWDKMSMWEILSKMDLLSRETAVAVPGATVFKSDWHVLFKDKNVCVMYDFDYPQEVNNEVRPGAGLMGALKVKKSIGHIVKEIKYVNWPEDSKDGFDVRDFLRKKKSHRSAYSTILTMLKSSPYVHEELKTEVQSDEKSDDEVFTGKRVSCEEVYSVYKKWLHMPDTTVIDVLYGSMIANRLDGEPLWMFIIAPSGATKTELLLSVSQAPRVVSTTALTPHSLVSGANFAGGGDPSLIPKLNGKVLIIKDFTTILNMNQMARDEILGILRDAYDGKTEKTFGNGIFRSYNSKFGIIAGVTPAIELYIAGQTAFGERFLGFKIKIPESYKGRLVYLSKAMGNNQSESKMKEELSELGKRVLSHNYKEIPEIPEIFQKKLMTLALWTSIMRGTVTRDKYSKEVIAKPFVELATRIVKQYTKLSTGIAMFRGKKKVTRAEYRVIKQVSISSVLSDLNELTKFMYHSGKDSWKEFREITKATRLPAENCRRKLEDLTMLNVIVKESKNMKSYYRIHEEMYELISENGIY